MATNDTWGVIDNQITVMSERNTRMDDTAKFLNWDDNPYELVKPDGLTPLRDAISVTPNLPKVFAHSVIADLLSGKYQTKVEGAITEGQAKVIETFVDDNFAQADEGLQEKYGIPSLDSFIVPHSCIRWAFGAMWSASIEDGEYKIDCQPVDMRWTPFVRGRWVAPISFQKKAELEQLLEGYEKRAKDKKVGEYFKISLGEDNEVRDFFNSEKHELWVDQKLVYKEKNRWGYPPFVIVVPASGFMLRDKGYLKNEGPDILYLNSGLYKEYARSLSLEQTAGYAGIYPGWEYESKNMDGKPARLPPELDAVVKVPEGELHQPLPRGDLNIGERTASAKIGGMIEAGGPTAPKPYTTPQTGIALMGEAELISRLQNVRKDALGIFKSQLARMMIKQFIDLGGSELLIGKQGKAGKHSAKELGDPDNYTISYHLSVKSKRQELANLMEFAAVSDRLPLEWTLPNILMADDPAGIIAALKMKKAKDINPALDFLEMAIEFARKAKKIEDETEADLLKLQSKIMLREYVMIMRARMQPQLSQAPTQQIEEPKGDARLLQTAAGALRGEAAGGRGGVESVQSREPEEVVE